MSHLGGPMATDTRRLLAALDPLHHRARIAHLAAWARSTTPEAGQGVRRDLAAGGPWERGLAVELAAWWRLDAPLLAALADPAVSVRTVAAARCATAVGDDAALAAAGAAADRATRHLLCRALARRGRQRVASLLAPHLIARGDAAALRPLVGLLEWEAITRVEARLGPHALPWRRLALSHPDRTLERMRGLLTALPHAALRDPWWRRLSGAVKVLAIDRGAALLEVWEAAPAPTFAPLLPALGPLLARHPDRIVAAITASRADFGWLRAGYRVRRHIASLSDAHLAQLARAMAPDEGPLLILLGAVAPSRRGALFAVMQDEAPHRRWSTAVLDLLPHPIRHGEARRQRALPEVKRELVVHRWLAGWLPLEEAEAELVPEGRPREREGLERARTWAAWAGVVGRERRGLDGLLAASRFLRNEQDPVRAGFISGLQQVPVSCFEARHVDALDALLTAVIEARDTSYASRYALQTLGHRLLVAHAEEPDGPLFRYSLRILERLQARGQPVALPRLDRGLRRGAEHAVVAAVLAWLEADTARESVGSTLALARALDDRAHTVPALQDLLGRIATTDRHTANRQAAIGLWIADPLHRDERVRQILDGDASAIAVHAVFDHVARRRQDWLDPYLEGRKLVGRWGSKKAGWVPHAPTACHTWLPRQRAALAATYQRLAADGGQNLYTRAAVLGHLPRLGVGVADLARWLSHPEVNLAEAALGGLVWADVPGPALPLLLDHLDGDRARVAMYALPRLAAWIPAMELEHALAGVLARKSLKVTVHKEAVRLLGGLRTPGAPELLRREWGRPALHRDVRLAMLHAAWARLDEAWAWDVVHSAVTHADPQVAEAVAAVSPRAIPPAFHARVLTNLLGLARHPAAEARRALCAHLARDADGLGPSDPIGAVEVSTALLVGEDPGSPVVAAAIDAALCMTSWCPGADALVQAIATLLDAASTQPLVSLDPAVPDRPAARRVIDLVERLAAKVVRERARYTPVAEALQGLLDARGEIRDAARLALAVHPGTAEADALAAVIAAAPHEHPFVATLVATAVADTERPWRVDDVLALEQSLTAGGPVRLALICAAAARHGWSPALRERLGELRADPVLGAAAREVRVDG